MRGYARHAVPVLFGFYALLGFVDGAFGVAFSGLLKRYGLSPATLAQAFLWGTAAALPLIWTAGRALAAPSRRRVLLALSGLVPAVSWLLLASPAGWVFLLAVALLAVVTAVLDVTVSGAALDVEAASGVPILGRVQAGFAAGAGVGALVGGLLLGGAWQGVFPVVVFAAAGLLAVTLLGVRLPVGARQVVGGRVRGVSPVLLLVLGASALCAYYAEGVMQSWSAMFLQRELGVSAVFAGVVSSGYFVMFALGAVGSSALILRWGTRRAVRAMSGAAALGALMFVSAGHPLYATLGVLLLGVGVAGLMPSLLSWAASAGLGVGAAGFVTTVGYGGMLLEPFIVSVSGDSLRPVFLTLPVLLLGTGLVTLLPRALGSARPALPVGGD